MSAASVLVPQLVERAVDEVTACLRMGLNANIDLVNSKYADARGTGRISMQHVPVDRYYETESVDPLIMPCVFVVADDSEHDLTGAQNVVKAYHKMFASLLVQDVEQRRLTRLAWRYAASMYLTLHDRGQGIDGQAPTCHILVRSIGYSPTFRSRGQSPDTGRAFRKDVTLTLEVQQYEAFQGYPR